MSENKINFLQKKYTKDRHLSKAESNALTQNTCPYCSYAPICHSESINGTEKICLFKSTESYRVWLRITDDRPSIEVGKTYGKTKVISFSHYDDPSRKRYQYWNCLRDNKQVIVRGDLLLRLDVEAKAERKYRRGSSINPDGTLHKYPMEHHSKVGCALEKTVTLIVEDEDGMKATHRYETRVLCECGAAMRYDEYGEGICSSCIGLERKHRKPNMDPEVKPNSGYKGMGPLDVRAIASDSSIRIEVPKKTAKELEEETAQLVLDYKRWCEGF